MDLKYLQFLPFNNLRIFCLTWQRMIDRGAYSHAFRSLQLVPWFSCLPIEVSPKRILMVLKSGEVEELIIPSNRSPELNPPVEEIPWFRARWSRHPPGFNSNHTFRQLGLLIWPFITQVWVVVRSENCSRLAIWNICGEAECAKKWSRSFGGTSDLVWWCFLFREALLRFVELDP